MKKIKVYDLRTYIESQNSDGKILTTHWFHKLAILTGDKGGVVFNNEGIGFSRGDIKYKIEIGLVDKITDGSIAVESQYKAKLSLKEIMDNANCEEMELTQFIDKYNYNDRLRTNFKKLIEIINKIGLNSNDYYSENQ